MRRLPLAPMAALAAVWALGLLLPADDAGISDVGLYRSIGEGVLDGYVPYRDFAFEYPPLAAGLFAAAAALPVEFAVAFGLVLLPFGWAIQVAARTPGVAWGVVALGALFQPLVLERYDLAPAALVAVAVAIVAARPILAFALIGAGTALKGFPLAVAPVLAIWLVRRARARDALRGGAVCALVVAACTLPFLAADPGGFADQFAFHGERPVQIESTPASVLLVLGVGEVSGVPERPDRFKSHGVVGSGADALELASTVLVLAALALVFAGAWRRSRPVAPGALAALLAVVALGKVLSPQFIVWLVPLALLAWRDGERAAAALVVAAAYVTTVYFPEHYYALVDRDAATIAVVAARNALLLAALAALLRPRRVARA